MVSFVLKGGLRQPLAKGEDFSLAGEIQAVQQLEQGAFTAAVSPQDGDFFPGANLQAGLWLAVAFSAANTVLFGAVVVWYLRDRGLAR